MNERDRDIEQALLQFRPVGPPASLRNRMLAAARAPLRARGSWRMATFWGALAAMLLVAVCLNFAAGSIARSVTSQVGIGPARWTPQAEEAAQILGGGPAARQYVALGLMSSIGREEKGLSHASVGRDLR
jgi:hypothetical protein